MKRPSCRRSSSTRSCRAHPRRRSTTSRATSGAGGRCRNTRAAKRVRPTSPSTDAWGASSRKSTSTARESVWGTVIVWERGSKVSFTWHPGKSPDTPLTVAITFDAAGDSTRVRLVHSGWERLGTIATEAREGYAKGWPSNHGTASTRATATRLLCKHGAACRSRPTRYFTGTVDAGPSPTICNSTGSPLVHAKCATFCGLDDDAARAQRFQLRFVERRALRVVERARQHGGDGPLLAVRVRDDRDVRGQLRVRGIHAGLPGIADDDCGFVAGVRRIGDELHLRETLSLTLTNRRSDIDSHRAVCLLCPH